MDAGLASIVASTITAISVVIVAVLINRKQDALAVKQAATHNLVNSRMDEMLALKDELLAAAKKSSKAEGVEEERLRESPAPQQVEVINEEPVHVVVKKPPASK